VPGTSEPDVDVTVQARSGDRDRRPVLLAPNVLEVAAALDLRNADLGEQLLRGECRLERTREEIGGGNRSLAVGAVGDEVRIECEQDRGHVGGRIGVGDRAADRPAVPDLRVADVSGGAGQ